MNWIHGAAYYPELWDKNTWEKDIEHMKHLGINTVRIGEFAWSIMEPNPDEYHFEKFVEAMDLLAENNISVILCTPTATPPIWISHNHPERMLSDGGVPFSHGGRQHVCTNNPYMLERTKKIVSEMAQKLGNHKAVIAWQIDNELKCDAGECYCEECGRQWHEWLSKKYNSIIELNQAWGNDSWSQTYQSFEQIPRPIRTPKLHNPSLVTNYTLFSYYKVVEFFKLQADIIRKYSKLPITHNGSPHFGADNDLMSKYQDFISFDSYPTSKDYLSYLFDCRRSRGLNSDRKFMCMETSPGFNGCTKSYDAIHPAGFLAAEATATFALGGSGFAYWHFHQHRAGCEMIHGSMLTADGQPSICYREVEKVNERISELKKVFNGFTPIKPKIAIQFSDFSRAMMKTENYHGMYYVSLLREFHDILTNEQYDIDIIPNDASLEGYSLIFTPFQYYLDDNTVERMRSFCENGGTWVVGPMTGIRTKDHTMYTDSAIEKNLSEMLGMKHLFLYPTLGSQCELSCGEFIDKMRYFTLSGEPVHARLLANVKQLDKRGTAVSCNNLGDGKIISFGAMPESKEMLKLLINLCVKESGVLPIAEATIGILSAEFVNEKEKMVFGFDFGGKGGELSVNEKQIHIDPYGFECIFLEKDKEI